MTTYHQPVMCDLVVQHLLRTTSHAPIFLDLTLGDGGHTEALLRQAPPACRVIGCDADPEALVRAQARLASMASQLIAVHANFSSCARVVQDASCDTVDGIVADLGVSSRQLDESTRGFSFRAGGPLDMRMDSTQGDPAATLVNEASETDLADWIYHYGDERFSRRIARRIVAARAERLFCTTDQLAAVVRDAVPSTGRRRGKTIDPATRTFQALRIAVNGELAHLEQMLAQAPDLLSRGAAMVVISYHSLEDRLVKHQFRAKAQQADFAVVTKRPVTPTDDEVRANPRARSAKLRVIERLAA